MMLCPECSKKHEKSIVWSAGSLTPGLNSKIFYDEDGKKHIHNSSPLITVFNCSSGHIFKKTKYTNCWCGWSALENATS